MTILGLALLSVLSGFPVASDPYSHYLELAKRHQATPEFNEFAAQCDFDPTIISPIYGVEVGNSWSRSTNISRAVYETESDFFSSAELWLKGGKPKAVVLWSLSLDVGSEVRTMVCINNAGKPENLRVTNWQVPAQGSSDSWTHELFERLDVGGKITSKQAFFVNAKGERVPKPQAAGEAEGSFDWVPDLAVISKIQSALLPTRPSLKGMKRN